MNNVVDLSGRLKPNTTNPEISVVEELERLLEEAKHGEILSAAFVLIRPGDNIHTSYVCNSSGHLLVAGAAYLLANLTCQTSSDKEI